MDWWQYLRPDNLIALGIWYVLLAVFAIWLILFIVECVKLLIKKTQLSACESVESLELELGKRIAIRGGKAPIAETGPAGSNVAQGTPSFASAVGDFYRLPHVKDGAVITQHVIAIFEAGWNNSQLQVESLIKNTANRLFNRNGFLRSILSLFIILGLLGTLLGLAHSLAQLLPMMPTSQQFSNNEVAIGLSNLLTQLRGAFAPSIWGVGFTILGVLFFSYYSHRCQSLVNELERLTLTVWVPKLYPSPFQQQLITLIQTEELIQQNRESIQNATKFAADIKADVEGFTNEIKNAKTTVEKLNTSSAQINEFADRFYASVGRLIPFQAELKQLYQKMMDDSKVFQDGVSKSLFETTETQRQAKETLTQQSAQLKELTEKLKGYEDAYIKSRQELDATLNTVMKEAGKAYHALGERNQEIATTIDESLSVPLRQQLTKQLVEVNETLTTKLGSIVDRFGTFETPIKTSAQNFEQIVATIDSRAGELMARLQNEYHNQNAANQEQLQRLENLNNQLISFLQSLTDVTSKQETSYTNLSSALPGLADRVTILNNNLKHLVDGGFPQPDTRGGVDMSGVEKQLRENAAKFLSVLDKLVHISDEIRKLQATRNGRQRAPQTVAVSQPQSRERVQESESPVRHGAIFNLPDEPARGGLISKVKAALKRLRRR